jgi:ribosomal protein S2
VLVLATDRGALHEIRNAEVPLMGLADTDTDPTPYLYPVFANDDSLDSIKYLMETLEEVRDKEASIALACNPVIELFQLLDNYFKSKILFLIHFDTNAS